MIRGALAAAITPLRDEGRAPDDEAFAPLVDFLRRAGLDGILALGTTGEGILLGVEERKRCAALFLQAAGGDFPVVVHCGAQTTQDTVTLAQHAAQAGAAAVAVIGPPYYALDERALLDHFRAAARACAPLPFYAYEFAARAGYSLPLPMIAKLREEAPNLRGLKVSNPTWERVEPYLIQGLDLFVGREALIARAMAAGGVGAVSGLAAAFPAEVAAHVRRPDPSDSERIATLRETLDGYPFIVAVKAVLRMRGVPVREEVRRPLRPLTDEERVRLRTSLEPWLS